MHLNIVDEEEEDSAQADDDDPINPLIDELFDEVESLRMQVRLILEASQFRALNLCQ